MTPEVRSLIQDEVAKAVAGLEPAVSQDDLAAVLAEAKAARAEAAKAQAAADAAAADAAKSREEVAALRQAAQDAAAKADAANELALQALAEAAALDDGSPLDQPLPPSAMVKSNKQAMEALVDAKAQALSDSIGDQPLSSKGAGHPRRSGNRARNLFVALEERVSDLEVAQAETAAVASTWMTIHAWSSSVGRRK